ncbi:MAG TPA: hypothetical protein VMA98_08140 [Candidatus Acidoferrales bacterium]|nr:hypothetical protein [Candidatus Acidoferrales bacterium]
MPERFTVDPGAETFLAPEFLPRRAELLADEQRVGIIRRYTMHGDVAGDAYAALIPQYGFRQLAAMLTQACEQGAESVDGAPPELAAFIADMERFPAWLDMTLVEKGARLERNAYAHRAPFAIRAGLMATFMNKYTALPMALTGTLSNKTAARRATETAIFFTTTVLPGAMQRHGAGFKAAAHVRLMHSMVRFNVLRAGHWDASIYGVPIPQVDQMPAGLFAVFILAQNVLREGRTTFTADERARVELARCRCFLLGLPEALLETTPQGIVDLMLTRHATLRNGFDRNCSALVTATMAADLRPDASLRSYAYGWLERGFSKLFFIQNSMRGNKKAAAQVGVRAGFADYVSAAATMILVGTQMAAYGIAARIPWIRDAADRSLVRAVTNQLERYSLVCRKEVRANG